MHHKKTALRGLLLACALTGATGLALAEPETAHTAPVPAEFEASLEAYPATLAIYRSLTPMQRLLAYRLAQQVKDVDAIRRIVVDLKLGRKAQLLPADLKDSGLRPEIAATTR